MPVTLPCPVVALTQQDFLDLLERVLPADYLAGLKNPGPGYEALQAMAAVGARLSLAVERFGCSAYILSAVSGSYGTGVVELYRDAANAEGISVVVKAGTVVKSSKGGRRFVTAADVTFSPSALGPITVAVTSEVQDFAVNELGAGVAMDGSALPGEIDTIVTLIEEPPVGDITFKVRQHAAITGGAHAALDQQGLDRGIARNALETDGAYRTRIRSLPDNISPDAFDRTLQQLLFPAGASYQFIETWDLAYQTCWDGPPDFIPGSNYDPTLFVYDDPRTEVTSFNNRWLDTNDYRGGVIVVVPAFGPVSDVGMAYDDTAGTSTALSNAHGRRAVSAFDVPTTLGFEYLHGCWDGYDQGRASLQKTVYDTLQGIKAAGISVALELQGQ